MKKILLLHILLIYTYLSVFSQNENLISLGARSTAMGNTSVTFTDVWSVHNNQAGLGFIQSSSVGLHYENRYGVSGLGYKSMVGAIKTGSGTFGVKFNYQGYSTYNNIETGISYGRSFGDYFSAGIQIDYIHTSLTQDYGSAGMALAEIGILAKPIENLIIGAHVYNPTMSQFKETTNTERIPTIFKFGAGYKFDNIAFLNAEVVKDIDYPFIFRAGLEFNLVKNFVARAGISSNNSLISFGAGYKTKGFHIDVAFSYHSYLGYSPFITLVYNFNKQ